MFLHNLMKAPSEIGNHLYILMTRERLMHMLCQTTNVDLEQLSLHMLSHACSKQDIEPVVAEMFLRLLFCPSFDQLLDANTQFRIEQKLPCKNILTIFLGTWILSTHGRYKCFLNLSVPGFQQLLSIKKPRQYNPSYILCPYFMSESKNLSNIQVCKFLEVSCLSFLPEYGPKLKEDYVSIGHLPKIQKGRKEKCCSCGLFNCCKSSWQKVLSGIFAVQVCYFVIIISELLILFLNRFGLS